MPFATLSKRSYLGRKSRRDTSERRDDAEATLSLISKECDDTFPEKSIKKLRCWSNIAKDKEFEGELKLQSRVPHIDRRENSPKSNTKYKSSPLHTTKPKNESPDYVEFYPEEKDQLVFLIQKLHMGREKKSQNDDCDRDTELDIKQSPKNDKSPTSTEADPHRARLIKFFEKYDHSKVSSIDGMLTQYKNHESLLYFFLVQKYNVDPSILGLSNKNRSLPETKKEESNDPLMSVIKQAAKNERQSKTREKSRMISKETTEVKDNKFLKPFTPKNKPSTHSKPTHCEKKMTELDTLIKRSSTNPREMEATSNINNGMPNKQNASITKTRSLSSTNEKSSHTAGKDFDLSEKNIVPEFSYSTDFSWISAATDEIEDSGTFSTLDSKKSNQIESLQKANLNDQDRRNTEELPDATGIIKNKDSDKSQLSNFISKYVSNEEPRKINVMLGSRRRGALDDDTTWNSSVLKSEVESDEEGNSVSTGDSSTITSYASTASDSLASDASTISTLTPAPVYDSRDDFFSRLGDSLLGPLARAEVPDKLFF